MIIIDIINSIFDILPQLILATSPACVFAGMGSGSQSGKLTFKKIFSGEGINILEDSTSLQFQVTGLSSIGISNCAIVMGDATNGITGSTYIKACQEYNAIYGVRIISGTFSPSSYSLCNQSPTSIIIAGRANCVKTKFSSRSNIIGGDGNFICTSGSLGLARYYGTILGGRTNKIYETDGGSIITSRLSCICDTGYISNSIIGGAINCIYQSAKYHTVVGGYCNRINGSKHSSIINSKLVTSSGCFNTSIGSIGTTKLEGNYIADISGICNVTSNSNNRQSFISTIYSTSESNNDLSSLISSCLLKLTSSKSSAIISSIDNCIVNSNYSSMISSCSSIICDSTTGFNTIMASSCGRIVGSTGSSIISSFGATISNSDCSLIISSNRSIIKDSNNSVLFSLAGAAYKNSGIYNSTSSVAIFQKCGAICSSLNSVTIGGSNNIMCKSINSGSIGLNSIFQKSLTGKFACRNFILSFEQASISQTNDDYSTDDNFLSGCQSYVYNSNRSTVISSYLTNVSYSDNSSVIGSYNTLILSSTNSVIIGSRSTCIESSQNSAIIAGWPGSSLQGCSETLRTAHLQITNTLCVVGNNPVVYCSWSGNINSISVCRGIITDIS